MRPIDALPPPPNWDARLSAMAKFGVLILAGGVVYSLAQTVIALQRGSALAALTAGGMTVTFSGFLATLAITWYAAPTHYAGSGDSGTTVRINPFILWCWGVTLVGAAIGSACYLALILRGLDELPLTTPGRATVTRYLMITLLVLSVTGLVAMLRRRGRAYLRIGPDEVEHADIFRTRTARWDDIVDISDKADRRTRNPVVFVLKDAKPIIVPNADRYETNFGALYWMVRHYWKHPENRDELSDGRALERLCNEQFAPE
ncbi:PH domain-containing protein [Mycobacterium sp.]|uniref:PH domain-containing protein n=1 Tax=Mycobacterium sp. TaxID=1785 RepID=UPI002D8BD267|nr:PH domain-containing protein [Mycobacterium sp.]